MCYDISHFTSVSVSVHLLTATSSIQCWVEIQQLALIKVALVLVKLASKLFAIYIVYERLFAYPGPTPNGYYGGMILAESAEDFHSFLFEHCLRAPVRFSRSDTSSYYGGMIFAESAEDVLGFILYISYQRLFAFRGPTRSGYYGGMILDESPEDFHGFLFVHCL